MPHDDVDRMLEAARVYVLLDDRGCPHCGAKVGPVMISASMWFCCRRHKVKWLAGWDYRQLRASEAEQLRCYDDAGLNECEHIRRDEVDALMMKAVVYDRWGCHSGAEHYRNVKWPLNTKGGQAMNGAAICPPNAESAATPAKA